MTDKKTLEDNNILVVENTNPQINLQAPLLDRIDTLIELSEDSFLADSFFETHHDLIQSVADDLSLTPMQTVLLMPFVASPDETLTSQRLRKYFLCSATRLFRVSADLTTLVHRRYVFHGGNFDREGFRLTKKAVAAFSDGHGLPEINWAGLSPYGFLNTFKKTHSDFTVRGELLNKEFYGEMNELIRQNDQLELVKALHELSLDEEHTAVLLFACRCLICDKRVEINIDEISDFFGEYEDIEYGLNTGRDILVKKKLLEPAGDNQLRRNVFKLTKHAKETLLKEFSIAEKKDEIVESGLFEVIRAKDIKRKKMFYSERNEKDLEVLASLLTEDKLQKVRQNFCKEGYRQGFNCLFYGAPGTERQRRHFSWLCTRAEILCKWKSLAFVISGMARQRKSSRIFLSNMLG